MKLGTNKIVALTIISCALIWSTSYSYFYDPLKKTRLELEEFYPIQLEDKIITKIISIDYPTKGKYKLFQVNNNSDYYPILLFQDDNQYENIQLFTEKRNS